MLHNPENYITQWAHVKKSETIKQMQTDEVGENGIELIIAAITTFFASILLIIGIRKNATGMILPWIIINVVDTIGGMIIFILKIVSYKTQVNPAKVTAAVCYFILTMYFIISVNAYYRALRRQKRLALQVLKSNSTLNSAVPGVSLSTTELHTFPSSRPRSLQSTSEDDDDEFILYLK